MLARADGALPLLAVGTQQRFGSMGGLAKAQNGGNVLLTLHTENAHVACLLHTHPIARGRVSASHTSNCTCCVSASHTSNCTWARGLLHTHPIAHGRGVCYVSWTARLLSWLPTLTIYFVSFPQASAVDRGSLRSCRNRLDQTHAPVSRRHVLHTHTHTHTHTHLPS